MLIDRVLDGRHIRYDGITVTTSWKTYLFGIQIVEEYILSLRNNLFVENNILINSKFINL